MTADTDEARFRRMEEDRWLAEQRELARTVPAVPAPPEPGWADVRAALGECVARTWNGIKALPGPFQVLLCFVVVWIFMFAAGWFG